MSEPVGKPQSQRLTEERRRHNCALDELRHEFACGRELDKEYHRHQKNLSEILGPDVETIVDGRSRTY